MGGGWTEGGRDGNHEDGLQFVLEYSSFNTRARARTHTQAHTHTHTPARSSAWTPTLIHERTHTHTHILTHANARMHAYE